ncbi:MAG TPA: carbohydrate kinase family protein [Gaiellales bacterium]
MTIGLIGHTVIDTIVGPDGAETQRLGGTPLYARRALQAAGADCVVVTRGADPGDAVVVPGGPAYGSRLDHRAGTRQVLARIGLAFTPDDVREHALPALGGCEWLHLGAQSAGDFPPETLALLVAAGHRLCLDGQGPARGPDPGPVRLRPFPPSVIAGVTILKLNRLEAEAATGGRPAGEALLRLGAPEVVVTMGPDGVVVATPHGLWEIPGTGAGRYADPTGAGDSFTAAYVLARSRGSGPAEATGEAERATDLLYL